jgi:hypothetical protein
MKIKMLILCLNIRMIKCENSFYHIRFGNANNIVSLRAHGSTDGVKTWKYEAGDQAVRPISKTS